MVELIPDEAQVAPFVGEGETLPVMLDVPS